MKNSISAILIFVFLLFPLFILYSEPLTESKLKNYSYHLAFSNKTITLKDGIHKSGTSPSEFTKITIDKFLILDLNGDNVSDAVVVLAGSYGGSGVFYELTALLSKGDQFIQTNSIILGDRVNVKNIKAHGSFITPFEASYATILIEIQTHKEDDSSCCPHQVKTYCYTIYEENLMPCEEAPQPAIVKKPAIYLYPKQKQQIQIELKPNGEITKTIPDYTNRWDVMATPDGKINGKYDYLFYEVMLYTTIPKSQEGWIVRFENLPKWFDQKLPELGLNEKEINDFKNYWLKELPYSRYYEIKPLSKDFIEKDLKLEIKPKPDSLIRVILLFKGANNPLTLKEPKIEKIERKGFTVVEWGGIAEDIEKSDIKPKYSFLSQDTGLIILRALDLKEHKLLVRVNSNGCTDKNSIKVNVDKIEGAKGSFPHYELTLIREIADQCKALLPEGEVIEYDLKSDLNINTKLPYTISVKNPVYPLLPDEPFFTFYKIKENTPKPAEDLELSLKKALISSTVKAIELEIKRYENSKDPNKNSKIEHLKKELERFKVLSPDIYVLNEAESTLSLTFGPLMPPIKKEVELILNGPIEIGSTLHVVGMSKSGPFYHVAGINENLLKKPLNGRFKARLYLIYKREYFGFIPNYYVYIDDLKTCENPYTLE